MISAIPFEKNGNLKNGFRKSEQRAASSETYISDTIIIQRRAGRLFRSWDARIKLLASVDDPNCLLETSQCLYELDEDEKHFWIQHNRIDIENSPSDFDYINASPKELEAIFQDTLATVIETENTLRRASLSPDLIQPLFQEEVAKAHNVRSVSHEIIRNICSRLGYESNISFPEDGPIVLSHGDVLGKNIILTSNGYRMID